MAYFTSQLCANGHLITAYAEKYPASLQKYCSICGAYTIMQCENCKKNIRGRSADELGYLGKYRIPSYCLNCGEPYPWTTSALESTKEILLLSEEIKSEDINTLEDTYKDLIVSTPKTQVAAMKFKMLLTKAGKATSDAIYQIMVDVLSEAVKKTVWPDN